MKRERERERGKRKKEKGRESATQREREKERKREADECNDNDKHADKNNVKRRDKITPPPSQGRPPEIAKRKIDTRKQSAKIGKNRQKSAKNRPIPTHHFFGSKIQ